MQQSLLILLWMLVGSILRFSQLTAKPPWTDEFATMVFSLGNSFQDIPLNQVISPEILLQPLRFNAHAGIQDVVHLILSEDNHPPLYFVLAHLWLKLFPASGDSGEHISLWAARSLPAAFGVLSIPAFYWLGRMAFASRIAGQLAAAMAAVCPYAVFLAQEARHYTLAILFTIASLGCCILAAKYMYRGISLPFTLVFGWILVNALGLSVHYFLGITLLAEVMAITLFLVRFIPKSSQHFWKNCWRLVIVIIGTSAAGFVWIALVLPRGYGNQMTGWIGNVYFNILTILGPIFQLLAAWVTMLCLFPVESSHLWIVIVSGAMMLLFFIWAIPVLWLGIKSNWQQPKFQVGTKILVSIMGSVIVIYLSTAYFLGIDITRGARYHFAYFAALLTLTASSLVYCWKNNNKNSQQTCKKATSFRKIFINFFSRDCRSTVVIFWLVGLLSSLTVITNLGYRKYYRPELLLPIIQENSSVPVLIAATHESLVQTGEMMGIAWELQKNQQKSNIKFILVTKKDKNAEQATKKLQEVVRKIPRPLDVWTVNFNAAISLNSIPAITLDKCLPDVTNYPYIDGYSYRRYRCS